MTQDLVDRIYEAAFLPEGWPDVLDRLAQVSGSAGGALLVARERQPPRWAASPALQGALRGFMLAQAWKSNERPSRSIAIGQRGFHRDVDIFSRQELDIDTTRAELAKYGFGWETGAVIAMPTGEVVTFSMDRRMEDGPHDPKMLPSLNGFWPHLARAGLMAARLGLERALSAVGLMETMGLPAAALSATGRILAINPMFDRLSALFVVLAHGGLALSFEPANDLLQLAVREANLRSDPMVRSIPVPGTEDRPAHVVHVLPLRRAAHDLFAGGCSLIVATTVSIAAVGPSQNILIGLFDLTPAEARLAVSLAQGKSLKQAAIEHGVQFSTTRSYLEQIFRKTGAHKQSQLVALLKGVQPIAL